MLFFFPLENRYGHGRTGRTSGAGPRPVSQGVATGSKSGYVKLATGFYTAPALLTFSSTYKVLKLGFNSPLQLLADTTPNVRC